MRRWVIFPLLALGVVCTPEGAVQAEVDAVYIEAGAMPASQAVLDYIERYRYIAVEEMVAHGIPASITLAQGILESGAGKSELASKSNNHFGIKCHTGWDGERVYHDDDAKGECFRKYKNAEESFRDHSIFLTGRSRYAELFTLDPTDYKGWARGLKKAGYATNPHYADRLIKLIEDYELFIYDKLTPDQLLAMEENKKVEQDESEIASEDANTKQYGTNIFYFNRIPTVIVQKGETPQILADRHVGRLNNFLKYNDISADTPLEPGTKFYLQPKRNKGLQKTHLVAVSETMWRISREEGVKLSKLYKYNLMEPGQEPAAGEVIYLRKKRETPPVLRQYPTTIPLKESEEIIIDEPLEEEQVIQEETLMEFEAEDEQANEEPRQPALEFESDTKTPLANNLTPVYHEIAPKETLYAISRQYNTTVEELMDWNGLDSFDIRIGQQLIVGYKE